MKNYIQLLILTLLIGSAPVQAQKIHFTDSGNYWRSYCPQFLEYPYYPASYSDWAGFKSDTVFNGKMFKEINCQSFFKIWDTSIDKRRHDPKKGFMLLF